MLLESASPSRTLAAEENVPPCFEAKHLWEVAPPPVDIVESSPQRPARWNR